jgi:signal transduction histidine kinase
MEALQKLIPLSQPEDSKKYFNRYRILEDSIQNARNSVKNQFAMVRYETEKHKADNLLLQNTNTIRYIWIISLAFVIVTGSIISILWYKRRERYLALKAANTVRESQLKTSKKVHDVVANGLYRVMSEVENSNKFDRDKMLDDLEVLYERSRDISYDDVISENSGQNFKETIRQLLTSFATPKTKVLIVGNTSGVWKELDIGTKDELKYVLQELMVNMTKHSGASSVAVRFEKKADTIMIYYTDNGVGILDGTKFKNGLTNTGNRIKSVGGNVTFGSGTTGGLNVQMQLPVSQ